MSKTKRLAEIYNPYFEPMKHYVDDTEKTYLQNQISSDEIETLSPLHDIMETCEVYSVQEIDSKPARKNSIAFKFLNIDGNASNFDLFSVTLNAMKYKFSVIGISETNIGSSQQNTYHLINYNSFYQDKIAAKKKGSGVALYTHNSINFCKVHEYSRTTEDIETIFASTKKPSVIYDSFHLSDRNNRDLIILKSNSQKQSNDHTASTHWNAFIKKIKYQIRIIL